MEPSICLKNMVSDIIMYVTLNTTNGVVLGKGAVDRNWHPDFEAIEGNKNCLILDPLICQEF
jgi:hypothetical protein